MLTDFQNMVNGSSPIPYFSDYGSCTYVPRPEFVKFDEFIEYEYLYYYTYHKKYFCCYGACTWSLEISSSDYKRIKKIINERNKPSVKQMVQLSLDF